MHFYSGLNANTSWGSYCLGFSKITFSLLRFYFQVLGLMLQLLCWPRTFLEALIPSSCLSPKKQKQKMRSTFFAVFWPKLYFLGWKTKFRGKPPPQKYKPQWSAFPRKTQVRGMIQLCCFTAFLTPTILCLPDANKILTRILGNSRDLQPLIT